MSITTTLLSHGENRLVPCFLCRSAWEERFVGVAIQSSEVLGTLCPRCLRYTPRQNASWIREYSESLRLAVLDLDDSMRSRPRMPESPEHCRSEILKVVQSTAQLQQLSAMLRRGTRDLKNYFSRTRRAFEQLRCQTERDVPEEFDPFLTSELDRINCVLSIGPELLRLPAWQTTVEDLRVAETKSIAAKFLLEESTVALIVDRRYRAYLQNSA